jgi:hypothetical protein
MKIGIHVDKGFSDRWIKYCDKFNIEYKIVNCYESNIINQLEDCDGLMWHWSHLDYKASLMARQLTLSLEAMGKKVFPDTNTSWHFDDKLGQKYLLEALRIPSIETHVFFDKDKSLNWIETTEFPKVFKLSGGAGASNVQLINNKAEAKLVIEKAFGEGFSAFNRKVIFKDRLTQLKQKKNTKAFINFLKGAIILIRPATPFEKQKGNDWGYVYFQEFVENNKFDTRIVVIGDKCFAIRRYNRENDFRASGSGMIEYDRASIDERCVEIAFNVTAKIKSQCLAFDFVFDSNGNPLIIEMSYGFSARAYDKCPGYWDRTLKWNEAPVTPEEFMIMDFISAT